MVDISRLLKKAFIVNKQGLKEFGTDSEEARENRIRWLMKKHGTTRHEVEAAEKEYEQKKQQPKEKPKPSMPREYSQFRMPSFPSISSSDSSRPKIPAAMGVYILLIVLSITSLILKNSVAYSPGISLFISIVLGLFFLVAVHYTPEARVKITLVWVVFSLDVLIQFVLGLFPESGFKNILITYHVFSWIILAVALFLMGVFDALGGGEHLGKAGTFVLVIIISIVLYLLFPLIVQSPLAFQDTTHAEYYHIAKTEVVKIGKTLEDTKNFWYDYFGCTFKATQAAVSFDSCLQSKRIVRYCGSNFEGSEQQDCIKQQQELAKQGARPGVAGSVSDAIKKVTTVELLVDDYFPKKTTDPKKLYAVTLTMENPREQIFMAKVECSFKKNKEIVAGKVFVNGEDKNEIQVVGRHQQIPVGCQPTADLNGKYTIEYNAVLSGLQTFSFLKRAFVSEKIDSTLRSQIGADNFKAKERASQGPAEFALLNFKFGTGEGTEPLVLVEEPLTFSFSVADVGDGEVLKVNSYNFHGLLDRGFGVDETKIGDKDCLLGNTVFVNKDQTKKREPSELKRCFLTLPFDLQGLSGNKFEVETFVADMNYDYKLTKSIPIEVAPLAVENETAPGSVS